MTGCKSCHTSHCNSHTEATDTMCSIKTFFYCKLFQLIQIALFPIMDIQFEHPPQILDCWTNFNVCLGLLSCWKAERRHTAGLRADLCILSFKISTSFSFFIMPCTQTRLPVPEAAKKHEGPTTTFNCVVGVEGQT